MAKRGQKMLATFSNERAPNWWGCQMPCCVPSQTRDFCNEIVFFSFLVLKEIASRSVILRHICKCHVKMFSI